MYVYIYIYMHTCMYTKSVHTYTYIYIYTSMYLCTRFQHVEPETPPAQGFAHYLSSRWVNQEIEYEKHGLWVWGLGLRGLGLRAQVLKDLSIRV